MSWGRMDSTWIRDDRGLKRFIAAAGVTGRHISALKVLLAIASHASYETASADLSYTDLEMLTGLTRPMVVAGVKVLKTEGLIDVERTSINTYRLLNASTPPWCKVPIERIMRGLKEIPNRGASALAAMKILLLLLVFRDNESSCASMTHKTIIEYTGVRPALVRQGIDHLIAHGFLHVGLGDPRYAAKVGHPVFVYSLKGHFTGGSYVRTRPMLAGLRAEEML